MVLVSIFVEFTPIKFSPLTLLVKWIGKIINKDTEKRLGEIEKTQEENTKSIGELKDYIELRFDEHERADLNRQAVDMRNEIINFAENLKLGRIYSEQQFEYILDKISEYHEHCQRYDIKNHYIDEAHEIIREFIQNNARKKISEAFK